MEKHFKNILIDELRKYRKANDLNLREMGEIIFVDYSHLSRIEKGERNIKEETLINALNLIGLDDFYDEKTIREFNDLFFHFYYYALAGDKRYKKYSDCIAKNVEKYRNSVLKYHYLLFEIIYESYLNIFVAIDKIVFLEDNSLFLSATEIKILQDLKSMYYTNRGDYNKAFDILAKLTNEQSESFVDAIFYHRMADILIRRMEYADALRYLRNAYIIFNKYSAKEMCYRIILDIAIVYYFLKENNKTKNILIDLLNKKPNDDITLRAKSLLLWCYIAIDDEKEIQKLTNLYSKGDLNNQFFISNILYYAYTKNDKELFYKFFNDDVLNSFDTYYKNIVTLFKEVLDRTEINTVLKISYDILESIDKNKHFEYYLIVEELIIILNIEKEKL